MKYLITGASGQVGNALCDYLGSSAVALDRAEMDLSQPETLAEKLEKYKPEAIINTAAYTAVDKAESEEAYARAINADAVRELARYAFAHNIPLIHYSTDYVFPGTGVKPWKEDDITAPQNAYGRTKLAGEQAIMEEADSLTSLHPHTPTPSYLIFRTSWVYAAAGHNFVNTMLRLGKEREVISVVNDQIGAPTFAGDIASATLAALEKARGMKHFPSGIYHLVNAGEVSWHGFAEEIFRKVLAMGAELAVHEVKYLRSSDYPTPAARPLNSRLDCAKLKATFGIALPDWRDALARCLEGKFGGECGHHACTCHHPEETA